ncbi:MULTISPECIES: TIGR00725 family protein [unclassified Leptolyngbya]|uniref:TIGR00725 family protein n=1 Tax=unclassified Leptolyngbya TaxID=2650499 RepID=UPI001686DC3D|nr:MULTISPECIES: TIGR00725 family protein [unclassified Leptolyngbya]MBD1912647.1 TIGR00725 family protein [Leptolyngbya sp. FACHB-8]MBD2156818.1 TIGR00725 family protein [Leptolyngbya sp. FACHB-16]
MSHILIGVMGPGDAATAEQYQDAYNLGFQVAQAEWVVLTGGRNVGVMDAACRGAKAAQGLTIGILPDSEERRTSPYVDIPIYTGMGHARNVINILSSRVVVACGMGAGTASEVAIALKTGKPIILLKPDAESEAFFYSLGTEHLYSVHQPEEAIGRIREILEIA